MKRGYKQTEVGVIPEDWNVDSFASVTPSNGRNGIVDGPFGSNLKTIHYRKSGIPIVTSGFVTEGRFFADSYLYVDKEKFDDEKRSAVQAGDIVMAKIGARCGASAILPEWHQIGILSGNALKITVDQSRHSTFYIWQVLWNLYLRGRMEALRTVGAQPAISMAQLKQYKIPLPPFSEQRAIATVLSDVDALLAAQDKLIAKKRDIKQAAMQQLLTGKQRLPGFSGEWEVKRLGDIATFFSGGTPSTSVPSYYGGDISWITSGDLNKEVIYEVEGKITRQGLNNSSAKLIQKHTLLVALYGATAGVAALSMIEAAINQAVLAIVPRADSNVFMYYKLVYLKDWIIKTYTQGGQPNLSGNIVKSIETVMPVLLEEQTAIATVLSDMDADLTALEQQRDKTRALKQGMMQELLTGRIRLV